MKKIAFYTLGCKVNTFETESIFELFKNTFERVDFKEQADVYVINTCTVTNTADSKSKKIIRNAAKREHDKIICVMGCFSQNNLEDAKNLENVDIIIGNDQKGKIYDLVMKKLSEKEKIKYLGVTDIFKVKDFEIQTATHFENTRAFLKIQDGCNNYCSYCIIPFVRGNLRSRDKENTLHEVKKIINNGYKEIVLSGIHTGKYGIDFADRKYLLKDLLSDLIQIEKLERLRISSIEINEICDEIIAQVKNNNKMAKHFHLPLQSGSNNVLKSMNRRYSKEDFLNKITKIKNEIPDICLTTDVIVGFPNETKEDFLETVKLCEEIGFFEIHVFPYSKRNNTKAATMDNQVHEKIKSERVFDLTNLSAYLKNKYMSKFINEEVEVIIETFDENNYAIGHTSNYLKVFVFNQNNCLKLNDLIRVRVDKIVSGKVIADFIKILKS